MMIRDEKKLLELLASVADTQEDELDCDAFLDRVSAYVEQLGSGAELSDDFWSVVKHLKICPECREEFEALLELYRSK